MKLKQLTPESIEEHILPVFDIEKSEKIKKKFSLKFWVKFIVEKFNLSVYLHWENSEK